MTPRRALVWFRVDLRLRDHRALYAAAEESGGGGVVGLFVIAASDWARHDWSPAKVGLLLRTLRVLSADLARLNIPLLIRVAGHHRDVPGIVAAVAREHRCGVVHANREYELHEAARDERAAAVLRGVGGAGIPLVLHHDQTVAEPGVVRTQAGGVFTVFSPFKRAWLKHVESAGGPGVLGTPRRQAALVCAPEAVPDAVAGYAPDPHASLWPGGEGEARRRLDAFVSGRIGRYKADRDRPDLEGTSGLSPYLAIGAISARTCVAAAAEANGGRLDGGDEGAACWISELVWREFYKHILVAFPRVCRGQAFKPETDRLRWNDRPEWLAAWQSGRTGFPIVDAGMRSLAATGWMHNRLRMITAMFLSKDLFLNWRLGERHFMRSLVDGDLSQNNGGWQWSASTGTDAAPYFRIFNPFSQSAKVDPDGAFIRRWVPELAGVAGEAVHNPSELPGLLRSRLDYPEPIVDHAQARDRVLAAFRGLG